MEEIYKKLDVTPSDINHFARFANDTCVTLIPDEYFTKIVDAIKDDIVQDIYETADHENWNSDDLGLAIGRVLCTKLGIEI